MLILSRTSKKGDKSLQIGSDVIVTVLRITEEAVTLGITAPKEIPILREELLDERPLEITHKNTEC
jgi:carbon storage regulator